MTVRVRRNGSLAKAWSTALCLGCGFERQGDSSTVTAWARRHAAKTGHSLTLDREVTYRVEPR